MSFADRTKYLAFIENQQLIESRWHKKYGDRLNELVFIGQSMEKDQIISELNDCLCTETEADLIEVQGYFDDPFPQW